MKVSVGKQAAVAVAAVGVLTLAACGDSGSGGAGGTGVGPIPIAFIGDLTGPPGTAPFPSGKTGVEAAVKAINDAGGVDGRKLKLSVCDTTLVQTKGLQCAREVVGSDAAAVVMYSQLQTALSPILASGKIPVINTNVLQASDLRGDNVFPTSIGEFGANRSMGVGLATVIGAKAPTLAYADVPAAGYFPSMVNSALTSNGGPQAKSVAVPINAPDMSVYATRMLAEKPDAAAIGTIAGDIDRLTAAIVKRDSSIKFIRSITVTPPSSIAGLGPAAANTYVVSSYRPLTDMSIPAVKQFNEDMAAVDSAYKPDAAAGTAAGTWAGVHVLSQALSEADDSSRAGVTAALTEGTFDVGIMPKPLQFKTPNAECGEPRCFNTAYQLFQITDGKLVPAAGADEGIVDAFARK